MSRNYRKIFARIIADPEYLQNLDWGKPRPGHPEGTVRAHILELERNLNHLRDRTTEEEYWKLRILIHVHDSFKAVASHGVAITDPRSHASLARAFLARYCDDADMQIMVQYHDEPFALWRQHWEKCRFDEARFRALLGRIEDWNLFLLFLIIDACTEGKERHAIRWFLREVQPGVSSVIGEEEVDLLSS